MPDSFTSSLNYLVPSKMVLKERANEFLISSFLSLFFLPDDAGAYKTLTYVLVFASHKLTSQLNNDTHTHGEYIVYTL